VLDGSTDGILVGTLEGTVDGKCDGLVLGIDDGCAERSKRVKENPGKASRFSTPSFVSSDGSRSNASS
jgi:hypothetical protein